MWWIYLCKRWAMPRGHGGDPRTHVPTYTCTLVLFHFYCICVTFCVGGGALKVLCTCLQRPVGGRRQNSELNSNPMPGGYSNSICAPELTKLKPWQDYFIFYCFVGVVLVVYMLSSPMTQHKQTCLNYVYMYSYM